MNNDTPDPSPTPRRWIARTIWVGALLLLILAGWRGWVYWQARDADARAQAIENEQRIAAMEQRIEGLRSNQRTQVQRIQDAANTNRILRGEILGLSQRGALFENSLARLEDTIARLADSNRHGAQALRLYETEILLEQAEQRIRIANDLEGARRAYALASRALDEVSNPELLNLRHALQQERDAVDALGEGPHHEIVIGLTVFSKNLDQLPEQSAVAAAKAPLWQRMLMPLVEIRPSLGSPVISADQRRAGTDALQIELTLARAALERNDPEEFHAALARAGAWLERLWPDSPELRQQREQLAALLKLPLQPELPVLGTTLQQLRTMHEGSAQP